MAFQHKKLLGTGKSRVVMKVWNSRGTRAEVDYTVTDELALKVYRTLLGIEDDKSSGDSGRVDEAQSEGDQATGDSPAG